MRIVVAILRLIKSGKTNKTAIAREVSESYHEQFAPNYVSRLLKDQLGDDLISHVVQWIVDRHDKNFRSLLEPGAIFKQVGIAASDFFGNFPSNERPDFLKEEDFERMSGVYMCSLFGDIRTYLPSSLIQYDLQSDGHTVPTGSISASGFFNRKALLTLRHQSGGYYEAAEIPIPYLYSPSFKARGASMIYEGIGVLSSNYLRVILRDSITQTSKFHTIYVGIKSKKPIHSSGMRFKPPKELRDNLTSIWDGMGNDHVLSMIEEFKEENESKCELSGCAQAESNPLSPYGRRGVKSVDLVYFRKPDTLLDKPELHFAYPNAIKGDGVSRILDNPLTVGLAR